MRPARGASYLDTSFVVPFYLLETSSGRVEGFLRSQPPGSLVLSSWGGVEFASTLARNVRMGLQEREKARALFDVFEADARALFRVHVPTAADFSLAASLLIGQPQSGLRGGDALHLAIAKNHGLTLYTLDKALLAAADTLGVAASDAGSGGAS